MSTFLKAACLVAVLEYSTFVSQISHGLLSSEIKDSVEGSGVTQCFQIKLKLHLGVICIMVKRDCVKEAVYKINS